MLYKKTCMKCGKEFETDFRGKVYCSDECRMAFFHQDLPPRPCRFCGEMFMPRRLNQLFCSRACLSHFWARAGGNDEPLTETVCPVCGKTFMPGRRGKIYCSSECQAIRRNEQARARAREVRRANLEAHARRMAAKAETCQPQPGKPAGLEEEYSHEF